MKIKSLDDEFKICCTPNYSTYVKVDENKIIIPNFFKTFKKAQKFFIERDIWETNIFDTNSKPGMETIFPKWFVKIFLEQYFIGNNIKDDINSYEAMCMYFYNGMRTKRNLSSIGIFPHIDALVTKDNFLAHVCLVNLNNFPVTTRFWKYNNKLFCENEMEKIEYYNFMIKKSKEFNSLNSQDEVNFLSNTPELVVQKEVTYDPNEALIYPLNLYHSAKLEETHTILNPRILLRMLYYSKVNCTYS